MGKIKNLFFDLDRTLWDFEKNSLTAFSFLHEKYFAEKFSFTKNELCEVYNRNNEELWDKLRKGIIDKDFLRENRFRLTLAELNIIDDKLAKILNDEYMHIYPRQPHVYPKTIETLTELKNRNFKIFLLTNGWYETQKLKIENSGLHNLIDKMITSDRAGHMKPDGRIFKFALKETNSTIENSLMVGDDYEVDIIGAEQIGMKAILFNYNNNMNTEYSNSISQINQLLSIL